MDKDLEKIICPNCGNPDCLADDEYCFNCGIPLKNCCMNETCILNSDGGDGELPPNMCYCPECGEKTYYFQKGYISPKKFKSD